MDAGDWEKFILHRLDEDQSLMEAFFERRATLAREAAGSLDVLRVLANLQERIRRLAVERMIVEEHRPYRDGHCRTCTGAPLHAPCPTLRIIAAAWADHEDYREEWL